VTNLELADRIEAIHPILLIGGAECPTIAITPELTAMIVAALRGSLAQAGQEAREKEITRLATIEECADIVEGQIVHHNCRQWPAISSQGNRSSDDPIVRHCDKLASAIRSLALPSTDEKSSVAKQGKRVRVTEPCRHPNCEFPACDCEWDPIPSVSSTNQGGGK
jgi:hypothetical protein